MSLEEMLPTFKENLDSIETTGGRFHYLKSILGSHPELKRDLYDYSMQAVSALSVKSAYANLDIPEWTARLWKQLGYYEEALSNLKNSKNNTTLSQARILLSLGKKEEAHKLVKNDVDKELKEISDKPGEEKAGHLYHLSQHVEEYEMPDLAKQLLEDAIKHALDSDSPYLAMSMIKREVTPRVTEKIQIDSNLKEDAYKAVIKEAENSGDFSAAERFCREAGWLDKAEFYIKLRISS